MSNDLLSAYNQSETNEDYDYSLGGLLTEYGASTPRGITKGLLTLGDIPYLGEGLVRGGIDLATAPFREGEDWFPSFNQDAKWLTQPYGSNVINYDANNKGILQTQDYDVPYFPDPNALDTGFQWGSLGGLNMGKNILTAPFNMRRTIHGLGFGTGSEYIQEGLDIESPENIWGLAVDTPSLVFNLIADYKTFRNSKGFIQKMLKETMGDIPDEKIQQQLVLIQDRLRKAKEEGVQLSAEQLFAEFPEMGSLYRVLSMMDNGKTARFNAEQGDILTQNLLKGVENLDDFPSFIKQQKVWFDNYKNFTNKTNKQFRDDIDEIKGQKIVDGVGNNGNMKTLLVENIDNAWNRVRNRSSVGGKQLEYFTDLLDDAIQTGDIDKLNNVLRRMENDLDTFKTNGMDIDGNKLNLEKGLDKIVKSLIDDSHLAVADNFDDYATARKTFEETMKNSIDPLRAEKLVAFIKDGKGDPKKIIQAIDLLMTSSNHMTDDLAPIVKGLRAINGDGVIDQVFEMHITKIIKSVTQGTSDDAIKVGEKLGKKRQSYDRIKTLIREDYKLKHGEYPTPSELDDASNGILIWLDTVKTFKTRQGESITQPLQAFQRYAQQYGFDPRDLANPSTWTREIRDQWAKWNAQKLQKFLENSKNLDEFIRMSKSGVTDDIINVIYHFVARPYGTIGAERMPYGYQARSDIKDQFNAQIQENKRISVDEVLKSGAW